MEQEKIEPTNVYSLNEAFKFCHFVGSFITMRRYVEKGELEAQNRAGRYFIKGTDLINFIENHENNKSKTA